MSSHTFSQKPTAPEMLEEAKLQLPIGLHHSTKTLVVRFAEALARKLRAAEIKYRRGAEWANKGWMEECRTDLLRHIQKGDPLDVATYAAFLWHHGESTAPQPPSAGAGDGPGPRPRTDAEWADEQVYPNGTPRENWRSAAFGMRDFARQLERNLSEMTRWKNEKDQTATTFMNQVKKLQQTLAAREQEIAGLRAALRRLYDADCLLRLRITSNARWAPLKEFSDWSKQTEAMGTVEDLLK